MLHGDILLWICKYFPPGFAYPVRRINNLFANHYVHHSTDVMRAFESDAYKDLTGPAAARIMNSFKCVHHRVDVCFRLAGQSRFFRGIFLYCQPQVHFHVKYVTKDRVSFLLRGKNGAEITKIFFPDRRRTVKIQDCTSISEWARRQWNSISRFSSAPVVIEPYRAGVRQFDMRSHQTRVAEDPIYWVREEWENGPLDAPSMRFERPESTEADIPPISSFTYDRRYADTAFWIKKIEERKTPKTPPPAFGPAFEVVFGVDELVGIHVILPLRNYTLLEWALVGPGAKHFTLDVHQAFQVAISELRDPMLMDWLYSKLTAEQVKSFEECFGLYQNCFEQWVIDWLLKHRCDIFKFFEEMVVEITTLAAGFDNSAVLQWGWKFQRDNGLDIDVGHVLVAAARNGNLEMIHWTLEQPEAADFGLTKQVKADTRWRSELHENIGLTQHFHVIDWLAELYKINGVTKP